MKKREHAQKWLRRFQIETVSHYFLRCKLCPWCKGAATYEEVLVELRAHMEACLGRAG